MLNIKSFLRGLRLLPVSTSGITVKGELEVLNTGGKLNYFDGATASPVVTESHAAVVTNKSIDADNNPISNLETDNLKSGVLITSTTLASATDTTIPSALAVKTYVDNKTAAQNEASEITYAPTGTIVATNVQAMGAELDNDIQAEIDRALAAEEIIEDNLAAHIADVANPHTVTKTQVGLGNVDNTSNATERAATATLTNKTLTAPVINSPTGIVKADVGLGNVDNTSDANKPISTTTQTALDLKAPIASPTFTGTVSGIDKTMVGLANVDNTTDANKPVSTATQSALDLKANLASPTFTGTVSGITKAMVGLTNVDDTSDATKNAATVTLTNKTLTGPAINNGVITGASIVTPLQSDVKQDTKANLITYAAGASEGQLVFATDESKMYQIISNALVEMASSSDLSKESNLLTNLGLAATVAANAMTLSLKTAAGSAPSAGDKVTVAFRSSTLATGQYSLVDVTGALTTVISSGSTAGTASAVASYIYAYLINNAGTAELAWSNSLFDEGSLITTVAEGGAGAADSITAMYSTTARSNVAFRLIGRVTSTQATAGTWATAPSEISLCPFDTYNQVSAFYTGAPPTGTLNSSFNKVTFGTKVGDTHNAYVSGTYTVPFSGSYDLHASINFVATIVAANDLYVSFYIDGSRIFSGLQRAQGSVTQTRVTNTVLAYPLRAGQLVEVRTSINSTGPSYSSDSSINFFSISKVGKYYV